MSFHPDYSLDAMAVDARGGSAAPQVDHEALEALTDEALKRVPELDREVLRLGARLARFTGLHVQRTEGLARDRGLTGSGLQVLSILWRQGPSEANEIARLSGVTRQSTSSGLATLERAGLIQRERSTTDRRRITVSLTPLGEARVRESLLSQNAHEGIWFSGLSAEDRAHLFTLVGKLIDGMHTDVEPEQGTGQAPDAGQGAAPEQSEPGTTAAR